MKQRASGTEWMDMPDADPEMLAKTLNYIDFTNRVLGGYRLLFSGLRTIINELPHNNTIRILDVGCGRGDQLRAISQWAENQGIAVSLTGIDNNPQAIAEASLLPTNSNIEFVCADALAPDFDYSRYHIVVCSLFLHHLEDVQIRRLFGLWNKNEVTVLVNDLQRSSLALILFKLFAMVTAAPAMARYDGALSVKKGFCAAELANFAESAGFKHYQLTREFAFRFRLILSNERVVR